MAFSAYTEQTVLKLLFGATAYTAATSYSVGLSFTDPNSSITEPTAGAYARVAYANTTGNWSAPTVDGTNGGYKVTNSNAITFPTATANWTNGANTSLAYFFIMDNQGTPNMIASGSLSTAKTVSNGDTASFAANALSITLN